MSVKPTATRYCEHCGEIITKDVDRYRYCSDLCGLLARDRLRKMCQRQRWDELMPEDTCDVLLRNPHSLDGMGMIAGDKLYLTREEYDAMDDERSRIWKLHARLVAMENEE